MNALKQKTDAHAIAMGKECEKILNHAGKMQQERTQRGHSHVGISYDSDASLDSTEAIRLYEDRTQSF